MSNTGGNSLHTKVIKFSYFMYPGSREYVGEWTLKGPDQKGNNIFFNWLNLAIWFNY